MTDLTQEQLQKIVGAGKLATARPWGPDPASDNETIAICSEQGEKHICILQLRYDPDLEDERLRGDPSDERRREDDAEYIWIAANSADIMAQELIDKRQRLLAIGKLCEEHASRNSGLIGVSELRAIMEGR